MRCALGLCFLINGLFASSFLPQMEILSKEPRVYVFHHFLSDSECDHLKKIAEPSLAPSIVVDLDAPTQGKRDSRRTSDGMFFPYDLKDSIVAEIEKRIAKVTGIPKECGENIQVIHYNRGEEYQPHYDYFDTSTIGGRHHCERGGQRQASFLMYLNTPEEGGETVFPKLSIKVKPVKGDALLFYNCDLSGTTDPLTLHGGAPVVKGEKWLATKWLRLGHFK